LDIYRQVFSRSARMGITYVVLGLAMGLVLTGAFNGVVRYASSLPNSPGVGNLGDLLGLMVVPFAAVVGLLIATPIYLLFVADKNAGVLEYLLAVGMGQRDVFWGYLKAAILLSMVGMVPMLALNVALAGDQLSTGAVASGLALITGVSDVALVTVLMTAYSSLQRRPTGMNSPLGITVGILLIMPEFFLIALLRTLILWLDLAIALVILGIAAFLLRSIDRLIVREKLLP